MELQKEGSGLNPKGTKSPMVSEEVSATLDKAGKSFLISEEVASFLDKGSSGFVVMSAGSSEILEADSKVKALYGDDIIGAYGDEVFPWMPDCPKLPDDGSVVEWENIDSSTGKYHRIESGVYEKDGKRYQIHHLIDITEYMQLNRDVTKYMSFFKRLSRFQAEVLKKLSTSYYELLPMLAGHYVTNRVYCMIQHKGTVDVITYSKVENQYSNDRVDLDGEVSKVFEDTEQRELSMASFAPSIQEIFTLGGNKEDAKFRCLCQGDVNGQRYAIYLGMWPNTDILSMKEPTILSVIKLYIENGIMRENLIYESEHDALTGLYNKGKYLEMSENVYPNLNSIAVFNFDVNNLKQMNDNFGHEAGDKLLIKAADSIRKVTSNQVHGYRMGGDEYLMVACDVKKDEADTLLTRWEQELARLNTFDDNINCVVAVGMVYAEKPYDLSTISKEADELMYEDKKRKKKPGEEIR